MNHIQSIIDESLLLQGDATTILPSLPDNFFRLILTDPPYNVSRKNNLRTMKRKGIDFGSWDKDFDQIAWLSEASRLLKPSGSIVIWNDWKNLGSIAKELENLGFSVKSFLTYKKTNPWPRNMHRRFISSTEHALWAVKSSKQKWVFNKRSDQSYETGVFEFPVQKAEHPNKKPNEMFTQLIEILSNKEDWILDPYCGGGTTCFAAHMTNRRFVAIERKKDYYEQAMRLWNSAKGLS